MALRRRRLRGIARRYDGRNTLRDEAGAPPLLGKPTSSAGPAHIEQVALADRRFTLEVRPGPSFFSLWDRSEPWAILLLGLAATGLTFALTTSVRRTENRSHALAVRMTDAIRRGERELRAVVDGTTDLIITFGSDGRFLLTNRAFGQLLGYSPEELAAMTVGDVVHPDARAEFDDALARAPAAPGSQQIETSFRARSGAEIQVDGALAFVLEEERRLTRAIFRDVSSRRQAERALLAANKALERLATMDSLTGVAGEDLLAAADSALYRAKSAGRNRVERACSGANAPPPV